jgi:hypothetical protein
MPGRLSKGVLLDERGGGPEHFLSALLDEREEKVMERKRRKSNRKVIQNR